MRYNNRDRLSTMNQSDATLLVVVMESAAEANHLSPTASTTSNTGRARFVHARSLAPPAGRCATPAQATSGEGADRFPRCIVARRPSRPDVRVPRVITSAGPRDAGYCQIRTMTGTPSIIEYGRRPGPGSDRSLPLSGCCVRVVRRSHSQ